MEKGDNDSRCNNSENLKNETFGESVRCAWRGMREAFRTEKNFAIYAKIALFFLAVNLICRVKAWFYPIYLLAVGGVFSAELINTAIEHMADMAADGICEEVRRIKDIAAAGVLFFGAVYFLVEFAILGMTLL